MKEEALSFFILPVRNEFIAAIKTNEGAFQVELSAETVERLADYYEIVKEGNPLLHLVAPCSAEEFAIRHILESLVLLKYLPENCRFADVGAGAGLPSIPCLIVRDDLTATLIESKVKKARYLEHALSRLDLATRATVLNKQFEEVREKDFRIVTCRALDRFTEKLPRLLKWTGKRKFLFFGGPAIDAALRHAKLRFDVELMPLSTQRYLLIGK